MAAFFTGILHRTRYDWGLVYPSFNFSELNRRPALLALPAQIVSQTRFDSGRNEIEMQPGYSGLRIAKERDAQA